jgi:hypothetical protein
MTKRVVLSTAAGGLAALDAGLADLVQDASGNGSMFLAGDGTFKAPGGGLVQSVKMTITSAQILALNSSPITVIAAPGANKFIYVFGAVYRTHFVTTRYTISDATIGLYYPPASTGDVADGAVNGVSNALANTVVDSIVFTTNGSVPFGGGDGVSALVNNSVVLSSESADPTGGDGTMSLNVLYCVLDVS